jgi:hypothetical protein
VLFLIITDADDIVPFIGTEESMKIIDFFENSLHGLTIDCMYLARRGEVHPLFAVPWDKDNCATVENNLNETMMAEIYFI